MTQAKKTQRLSQQIRHEMGADQQSSQMIIFSVILTIAREALTAKLSPKPTGSLTAVVLIGAVWTLLDAIAVGRGWQAGVIGAQEPFTLSPL